MIDYSLQMFLDGITANWNLNRLSIYWDKYNFHLTSSNELRVPTFRASPRFCVLWVVASSNRNLLNTFYQNRLPCTLSVRSLVSSHRSTTGRDDGWDKKRVVTLFLQKRLGAFISFVKKLVIKGEPKIQDIFEMK